MSNDFEKHLAQIFILPSVFKERFIMSEMNVNAVPCQCSAVCPPRSDSGQQTIMRDRAAVPTSSANIPPLDKNGTAVDRNQVPSVMNQPQDNPLNAMVQQIVASVLLLVQQMIDKVMGAVFGARSTGASPTVSPQQTTTAQTNSSQTNNNSGFFGGVLGEARSLVDLLDLVKENAPKIPETFDAVLDVGKSLFNSVWNPISSIFGLGSTSSDAGS